MRKLGVFLAVLLISGATTMIISALWLASIALLDAGLGIRPQVGIFVLPSTLGVLVGAIFFLPVELKNAVPARIFSFAGPIPNLDTPRLQFRNPIVLREKSRAGEPTAEFAPTGSRSRRSALRSILVVHQQGVKSQKESRVAA